MCYGNIASGSKCVDIGVNEVLNFNLRDLEIDIGPWIVPHDEEFNSAHGIHMSPRFIDEFKPNNCLGCTQNIQDEKFLLEIHQTLKAPLLQLCGKWIMHRKGMSLITCNVIFHLIQWLYQCSDANRILTSIDNKLREILIWNDLHTSSIGHQSAALKEG